MTLDEFRDKYNPPPGIAHMVDYRGRGSVLVESFAIYDTANLNDPLVQQKNKLLDENPEYWETVWHDQGPCSNWGTNVWRWETEEEEEARIKKQIARALEVREEMREAAKNSTGYDLEISLRKPGKTHVLPLEEWSGTKNTTTLIFDTLLFDKIQEEDRTLIFSPPLSVGVFFDWGEGKALCVFDFGMEIEMGLGSPIVGKVEGNENKIRKLIEFELFHSFCHPSEDPNYNLLNWALYGNLQGRVAILE